MCNCGGGSFRSSGASRRPAPSAAHVAQSRVTYSAKPPSPMRAPETAPAQIVQSQVIRRQNVRRAV